MPDRHLPLTVVDDAGARHQGELVVTSAWRNDLTLDPNIEFAIVLTEETIDASNDVPPAANIVVCVPEQPVHASAAVAEAAATYGSDAPPAPLRLTKAALESYARGRLLSPLALAIAPSEIFANGGTRPQLELLGRELVTAKAARSGRFWKALAEALALPGAPDPVTNPQRVRSNLERVLTQAPTLTSSASGHDALARLRRIVDGAAPEDVASSTGEIADDAGRARCLSEQPEAVTELASMRAYLHGARIDSDTGDLASDRTLTREQLSFITLLGEPHQLAGMRATFDMFRTSYETAYAKAHDAYWQAAGQARVALDAAEPASRALERLNTLRALGRPVGGEALTAYGRLRNGKSVCTQRDVPAALHTNPLCPDCGFAIGDATPDAVTNDTLAKLRDALAKQQSRLASEAVRRILARGGERIEQFLQIAQASDQTGLTQVLDDELLAFLRELLAEPVSLTAEAFDLVEELARAFPVVSEEQVDDAVEALRALIIERLAAQQANGLSQRAAIRLADTP